ncbi:hypothetical protein L596_003777 [Steinernema carpocapsae]|uniref:Intraflagellar transport protein 20 homolog n=1 Tax=Steinernema carpocapsae TaxID=34508 RepID=A0A4U8UTT1_STECR|nr:hypothetical protein L596_003777 [Steinernema carpocapsae]
MSDDFLTKTGLHIDDLNKIRLLEPDLSNAAEQLKQECNNFSEKMSSFKDFIESVVDTLEQLSRLVDSERLRAMASRSALTFLGSQKQAENQQMQILIQEKTIELQRLQTELAALVSVEQQQREHLEKLNAPI